jgi:ubiquinol-cytochrome c reductase subunit 9
MSVFQSLRQTWLRRNTFFLATVFSTALISEILIDGGVEKFWEWKNRGKLWKDLELKISQEQSGEDM